MPRHLTLGLLLACLAAQGQPPSGLKTLTKELERAIREDDLDSASDLAQMRASLLQDARQRIEEVLAWLPPDTETFFVAQEPMVLKAEDSAAMFYGRPARQHALDRLMAISQGLFYRRLQDRTIRLMVAGMRNMRSQGMGVPGLMPEADVAYFYFFTEPLDSAAFGPPEQSLQSRPLWRGTAKIITSGSWEPGVAIPFGETHLTIREPPKRKDETWLTMAGPNLLLMASNREFLDEILGRIERRASGRALPDSLPEWAQVDRRASFWGLRHYSDPGDRKDSSNPRATGEGSVQRDASAVGFTMQFYVDGDAVDIRYLSRAAHGSIPQIEREFTADQPAPNVWRLKSNIRDRGDFPFHFGADMLGFGDYR